MGVGAVKVDAYASLVHHRGGMLAVLAIGLLGVVLRPKPVGIAAFAAAILALALAPHPFVLGVALGVGAFVVLMTLFFAISTALHARQEHTVRGRRA